MAKRKQREKVPYAEGDVGVLQRFVNTITDSRELDSPEKLADWLSSHGYLEEGASVGKEDWEQAVKFRSDLYVLFACHTRHKALPPEVVASLNGAMTPTPYLARFDNRGRVTRRVTTGGWEGARARLCDTLAQLQNEGMRNVLICENCHEVFFPPTQAMRWCSGRCGSRVSSENYRKGHRYR